MRTLDGPTSAAIADRSVIPRDFLWVTAKNRDTGAAVSHGMWSDVGTVDASVVDVLTGATVSRTWEGAGGLINIGSVKMGVGLVVNRVSITLSQIDPLAEEIIRGLDPKYSRVELYRGWLDPVSMLLVAPATAQFVGFLDATPITTPKENEEGGISLTCSSYLQELTRSSSSKRSDADQRKRAPQDAFFQHTPVVGEWPINWGVPDPPDTPS